MMLDVIVRGGAVFDGSGAPPGVRDVGDYFAALERTGVAINVACFAGHGSVRAAAMGLESRPASDREIGRMQDLLAEALDEGAIGMSTGLAYPPGTNADRRELTALC